MDISKRTKRMFEGVDFKDVICNAFKPTQETKDALDDMAEYYPEFRVPFLSWGIHMYIEAIKDVVPKAMLGSLVVGYLVGRISKR